MATFVFWGRNHAIGEKNNIALLDRRFSKPPCLPQPVNKYVLHNCDNTSVPVVMKEPFENKLHNVAFIDIAPIEIVSWGFVQQLRID